MKTKTIFLTCLLVFSYCSNSDSLSSAQSECINSLSMMDTEKTEQITSFYVVGHGYGNHDGNNLGLSNKIINYLKILITNQILFLPVMLLEILI